MCIDHVYILSVPVQAAADNNWIEDTSLAAGDENVLQGCDDLDSAEDDSDFCDYFRAFTAMQLIAVLLASFSMVVYMVAPFRPRAGKCGSVKVGCTVVKYVAFILCTDEEREGRTLLA